MRYAAALAVILAATPALGADKGAPATFTDIMAIKAASPARCYVETSVAGTFLRADRVANYGIGGGCDLTLANMVIGGGLRGDWTDGAGTAAGSIFAKLGISINNGAVVYGLAEWKVPEWRIKDAGQRGLGAGAELSLNMINPNLSVFSEGTWAASKFGTATKDDVNARIGLRYKF
jgi:hypothetical protein